MTTKYVVKEGTMEWFLGDSANDIREPKATGLVKLIRHSDVGLQFIVPVGSSDLSNQTKQYELRRDNLGCLAIVKYASGNSIKRIATGDKKVLIILLKDQVWSTLVLSPKRTMQSDVDVGEWKKLILNQLFSDLSYKEFSQLTSKKGKHDLHVTPSFVSLAPSLGCALEGREKVLKLCNELKKNVWSVESFDEHIQVYPEDQHKLTITYPHQEPVSYNLESCNSTIGNLIDLLKARIDKHEYCENPKPVFNSREPTLSEDEPGNGSKRPPEPLPRRSKSTPPTLPQASASEFSTDPPYWLTTEELNTEIPPHSLDPGSPSTRLKPNRPPLVKQRSIYSDLIRKGKFQDKIYKPSKQIIVMRAKEIKKKPVSQRITQILDIGSIGNPQDFDSNLRRSEDIDAEFEDTYNYTNTKRMAIVSREDIDMSSSSIDVTIFKIFKDKDHTSLNSLRRCPLGLGGNRLIFVLRLEQYNWKMFAYYVFGDKLPSEDMNLIEEIGFRYGPPTVDILLTHWQRIYELESNLLPPNAESIARILKKMQLLDLIDMLGWTELCDNLVEQ